MSALRWVGFIAACFGMGLNLELLISGSRIHPALNLLGFALCLVAIVAARWR